MVSFWKNVSGLTWLLFIGFIQTEAIAEENSLPTRPALEFSLPKNEIALYTKENLIISCKPPANSVAFDVQWISPLNERITPSTGRMHVELKNVKDDRVYLIINNIQYSDKGAYTCMANVDGVEISRTFHLHVLKRIEYKDTPHVQTTSEGVDYMIRCIVDGDPKPLVYWRYKYSEDERFRETAEGLFVLNVSRSDAGDYRCNAMQQHTKEADMKSRIIKLVVKYKPEFKPTVTKKIFSYVTGVVNLTCDAHGVPPPEFKWYHNGELLNEETSSRQYSTFNTDERGILEISIFNKSDFGKYVCHVENEIGAIQKNVTLEEAAEPSVPSVTVKVYQPNSIELNITSSFVGELKVLGFRVQYKPEEEVWDDEKDLFDFNVGSKYVVDNLESGKTYHVRVAARNQAGISKYTEPLTIETMKLTEVPMTDTENSTGSAIIYYDHLHVVCLVTAASIVWIPRC